MHQIEGGAGLNERERGRAAGHHLERCQKAHGRFLLLGEPCALISPEYFDEPDPRFACRDIRFCGLDTRSNRSGQRQRLRALILRGSGLRLEPIGPGAGSSRLRLGKAQRTTFIIKRLRACNRSQQRQTCEDWQGTERPLGQSPICFRYRVSRISLQIPQSPLWLATPPARSSYHVRSGL